MLIKDFLKKEKKNKLEIKIVMFDEFVIYES
jgi:hypothetical protein